MQKNLCAAIGDFDGVHLGHRKVIKTAIELSVNLIPSVYTFSNNCKQAPFLTDNNTKKHILESLGIKKVIFDDFQSVKDLSPEAFVRDIIAEKYGIASLICGDDFKFGKNAGGDIKLLKNLCSKYNINLTTVEHLYSGGKKISSTDIRKHIEIGSIEKANTLLGRYFQLNGVVKHGKRLATKHNTPTINMEFKPNSVIPRFGVYITKTTIDGRQYNSVTNIGVRPSVESTDIPNIETNILDFNSDIYNAYVSIDFIKLIRPEIKFNSKHELFEQIKKDIITANNYFNGENND